ncbi:MAG TPA: haloacid dehalogenase-like hydrolase, partial [Thermoplasmata archaeon]|nr:haloacid dehalogenase-like hydrolase [Thermoplasmata archaeon]
GRLAEFDRVNDLFHRRKTSEDDHLRDLANLAAGCRLEEVQSILADTPKIRGIAETVQSLHDRGSRVALLTHNPEYVCEWYRNRYGFDDFEGTVTGQLADGFISRAVAVKADKLRGVERLLARADALPRQAAHVGDSWADALVFPTVGGGVALNSRLPEVRRAADLALELADLVEIVPALATLRPRTV